jgi:hypothetical protein
MEGSHLSRSKIEVLPGQEIMNATEGTRYLKSTLLTVPDIPYTIEVIMGALFQILMLPSIKTNHTNINAIRAAAFILSEIDTDKKAQVITEAVMVKLDIQMEALKKELLVVTAMIREKTIKATDALKK